MRRKNRIVVLSFLAIALLCWASLETFHLYSAFHYLKIPNSETRKPFGSNIHGWMSVDELGECYQVPPAEIFAALDIKPEAGDEHLSLRHLAQKYDKSFADMVEVLHRLPEQPEPFPNSGGQ